MNYLITGASQGIGYQTALALAASPDNTVLAVSRNDARLAELAADARRQNGHDNIRHLAIDLMDFDAGALQAWVRQEVGELHGVVNNAGILINKPFAELTDEDWHLSLTTNLLGVVRLLRAIHPLLAHAHVVNISSMGGFQGSSKFPGLSAYSASKAALANLTECLAEEWKDSGIACNCLALGAVQTEMLATAFPGFQAPVTAEQMGQWVALFLQQGHRLFNGKVLPVSVSTP